MAATIPARDIRRQSLNVGWSFPELSLPDRFRAAGANGFRFVECHYPYNETIDALARALDDARVSLVSINAWKGRNGQLGLASVNGAEEEFRQSMRQALHYATELGADCIHVLSGLFTGGSRRAALARLVANFQWATEKAGAADLTLLMEPLNTRDRPGYLLSRAGEVADVIAEIGAPNILLMFDVYHVAMMEGDPLPHLANHAAIIGHVQTAGVPDHHEPYSGTVDYTTVYDALDAVGYTGKIGAEYEPRGDTVAGLAWMDRLDIVR